MQLAGLVVQSVMSATDMLLDLSAADPWPRLRISAYTMPKNVGMPS